MARALYSDLFLIFSPPASGGLINQTSINSFITTLYKEAAISVLIDYTTDTNAFLDDERVKGTIVQRASDVVNQWYRSTSNKYQDTKPPSFHLTDIDKSQLRATLKFTFGFASYEDTPTQETGDGN